MDPVADPTGQARAELTVRVDGRDLLLPTYEAETLVRAAGWILVLRGTGFGLAAALGGIALRGGGYGAAGQLAAVLIGFAQAAIGAGLMRRMRWAWLALPVEVLAWGILIVALFVPQMYGPRSMLQLVRADFVTRTLLASFILPDLFAVYAAYRADGRRAGGRGLPPLPSLVGAWRTRLTGLIVVAVGMAMLAALSMAASLILGPGFLIA